MKFRDYFNFQGIMYGFFMIFFIIFCYRFGIAGIILEPLNKWNMIFNIGTWFVLVSYCMDEFFSAATRAEQRRIKKEKKK